MYESFLAANPKSTKWFIYSDEGW